ncbi:MAG: sulfurtransferase [Deinococcales bacterium]
MQPFIEVADLLARLGDPSLRVLDARFELLDPEAGRKQYREGHVPGALFTDLDEDLADRPGVHGGRHPLPDMAAFVERLARRGVGDRHEIVVYDQGGTFFASRAWWMLRYVGHDKVRVLDGGFREFVEEGGAPDVDEPVLPAASLSFRQPLDPRAGHIPSAVNVPYGLTMNEAGRALAPAALRERFAAVIARGEVVSYCGSGVSAAHNILALEAAGVGSARLYVGSWSDWCSYADAPVALGDEPRG